MFPSVIRVGRPRARPTRMSAPEPPLFILGAVLGTALTWSDRRLRFLLLPLGLAAGLLSLELFWQIHDPTQLNRQGPDTGTQYRSAIFTFDDAQKEIAERSKAMAAEHILGNRPIATEITPAGPYWRAEDYHQRFEERRMTATARL